MSVSMDYLDGLGREARNDLDLKLDVANGYMLTAQVQGVALTPNLGRSKRRMRVLPRPRGLWRAFSRPRRQEPTRFCWARRSSGTG